MAVIRLERPENTRPELVNVFAPLASLEKVIGHSLGGRGHSVLSAATGCTRVLRQAGISAAMAAADPRVATASATVAISKLGIRHINVHALRHSFATRLANSNISSMLLKGLMEHNSPSTTRRYFKLHDTTLARGYFSAMEFLHL